jgi:hypothetical protein
MIHKISKWTVKIHCCQVLKTQKIQDNKYLKLLFQDCRYKDNLKILRITQLPAESHSLNHKIREEYVAATLASCQVVWLRRILKDMSRTEKDPTPILCDNTSAIALSKNHVFHKKNKHIDTHFHLIRELVNNGDIVLQFCGSRDQLADIFTKPLGKSVFDFQRQHLGIISADDCNC